MASNVEDLLNVINSRSQKLQFACGSIKEAIREKRIPKKFSDEALELVMQINSFLQEDLCNVRELLECYKQILSGEKEQTSPQITDDDIGHTYGYSMYQIDLFQSKANNLENLMLPRYIL